jgi:uracil-DNA glycosylase family 4
MLTRPPTCSGCPLNDYSTGFMVPQIGTNGVALVGEALGEDEAKAGKPFVGKAGFKLTRLIEFAGLDRKDFSIFNTVWCRPPDNKLEGTTFEKPAISHCQDRHWGRLLAQHKVLVPMGNVATGALLGFKHILNTRGYVYPGPDGAHIIPTVHPSFIQRGQSRWSAPFISDVQKAVELAQNGLPPVFLDYLLDPSPLDAYKWAQGYVSWLRDHPETYLAFDIETPGKGDDEDDLETDSDAPDATWHIHRIGFSYRGHSALSIPWEPAFMAAIRLILDTSGPKVVWNAGFDVPRIRRAGVQIQGTIHDGMVAWHILHSDLPKRLGFVATFTCPWQPAWKHLSGAKPAFYNATDADVEFRSMVAIEAELRRTGLWSVYERDVLDLDPVLVHMQNAGMPVDGEVRIDRAKRLSEMRQDTLARLAGKFPLETRKIDHVYVETPKEVEGLLVRPGIRRRMFCPECGLEKPRKDHFRILKTKKRACGGLTPVEREVQVDEYYRLAEFTPSRDQLIRYHNHLSRPVPTVYDRKERKRKVSFGESEMRKLILSYPLDEVYPLVLEYRSQDKIAGTYIGRPNGIHSN